MDRTVAKKAIGPAMNNPSCWLQKSYVICFAKKKKKKKQSNSFLLLPQ